VARSEMTGRSFLVLNQKWHKLCCENSSCKFLSFTTLQIHSGQRQVCDLLKFQLCIIGVNRTVEAHLVVCTVTKTKYYNSVKVKTFGPSQNFRLASLLLCMICGSNFSWIKVQSTSGTVYEAFNFSLKLLSVLSSRGVVGRERVGITFPHLFHILLFNGFEGVLKRLCFGCVPTPFSLALHLCS